MLDETHESHGPRSGIDAPERAQPFGDRSEQSYPRPHPWSFRVGRVAKAGQTSVIVGKVLDGGRDVNLEQVRRGMAGHYKYHQLEQDTLGRARYSDAEIERGRHGVGYGPTMGRSRLGNGEQRVSRIQRRNLRPRKVLIPLDTNNAGPGFALRVPKGPLEAHLRGRGLQAPMLVERR